MLKSWVSLFYTALIFLFFSVTNNLAQSDYNALISSGIENTLNFNYKKAEDIFNQALAKEPLNPNAYFQLSQIYLWFFLGSKDIGDFKLFQKYSDLALEKLDIMDEQNETAEMYYLRGQIEMARAIGLGASGEMMSAFWASKASVNAFEDALDENPKMYEAHIGIGVFNYALSFVPGMLQFAIGITGLSSDKTSGLLNLSMGLKSSTTDKYTAAFHLAKIYAEYVADFDSAKIVSKMITSKYPNNELFQYQAGIAYILAGDFNNAEKHLNKAIKINHPKFSMTTSLSIFLKGDIYYRRNQFETAIKYYKEFIKKAVAVDFIGIANYRIAVSYLMLNDEHSAKKHILLANMGNQDIAEDVYASENGKKLLKDWDAPYFKEMIITENNLLAADYNKIMKQYANKAETNDIVYNSFRLAILGWAYTKTGKYLEAILTAEKSLNIEFENELWCKSLAALTIAEANNKLGNKNKTIEYIEIAEDNLAEQNKTFIESRINRLKREFGNLD